MEVDQENDDKKDSTSTDDDFEDTYSKLLNEQRV